MSRELWAVERCEHGFDERHHLFGGFRQRRIVGICGGNRKPLDFDAIWRRYYDTANRRFESGLTYNELWEVVFGVQLVGVPEKEDV